MAVRFDLKTVDEVLSHYKVTEEAGLNDAQVEASRKEHGWNELDKEEATPLWQLVLEQFDDALVKILLAAAMVSFVLAWMDEDNHGEGIGAYVEPFVILVILVLNAVVGVWQESNAESALEALKNLQPENARVLRNGHMQTIAARELVPGDVVEVRVGDKVPADMRLISLKTTAMRAEQSQMTGESVSVNKDIDELPANTEDVIQAKKNMLFATTVIVNGMGHGVVVKVGMETEIGQIQKSVQAAAEDEESTPLKKKLDEFGELLSKVIGVICLVVWLINYKNFFDPVHGSVFKGCIYYFKIAVALAVAAIPEGLPAVITTCLALGTKKMAKKNAIVRKLPSVETLGCTTVICSDKTGTLTTNEMSCVSFTHPGATEGDLITYEVEGHTYAPLGAIHTTQVRSEKSVFSLATVCAMCNESEIEYNEGKYVRVGEPTEAALRVLVEKAGVPDAAAQAEFEGLRKTNPAKAVQYCNSFWKRQFKKLATLEFSRDRKSMSVLCASVATKANVLFVKGAPEGLLHRCTHVQLSNGTTVALTETGKKAILAKVTEMAGLSLRCLAVAQKTSNLGNLASYDGDRHHAAHKTLEQTDNFASIESGLTFLGLTGMLDPPRPEVRPMIAMCNTAGIRVIMITGDNKLTAESVCRKIGIFEADEDVSTKSFTGAEFFALPAEKQVALLMNKEDTGMAFSRTEPKHKQMLVKMLKQNGEVTAMTGDGVNDAPALKQADIGIAMGISGTEVAKEAADMVLADDNFATIVSAVEEGRAIYNNMQAFIRYLISSNIGEVAAIFFTAALGLPEGLIPVQLLWVNLVTDGPPATALGFNPADKDIMTKPPRRANDVLINGWVFFRYMVVGIYVGFACVGVFGYWYMFYDGSNDGHSLITYHQLTNWGKCATWSNFTVNNFDGHDFSADPCAYFTVGKAKASTLSLSVLVAIEMFNALNALSEDGSLVTMPPWSNPYLIIAMLVSFGLHFVILYVDWLAAIFSVTPLDLNEWLVVLAFSLPVILIDEVLKLFGRHFAARDLEKRMAAKLKHE
ncbi:Ca2+-transporting ATPase [Saprolegnia diclina VS20]|uniref:P-type Ca(2+) transporter n=1 Tax=Saprolegnia diclina (strain VS20) TaxID=1156394 RepID=T0QFN2_SAPDV|nr:Ca2+-transporting ATPase [Saprolegnia diclina VS20]EQC36759.1 Ca2+-transporting ATPase [Saprolegnia diclina VS20]|eukprot:XP_008609540.1 Ca2+-transporting ATPase [Saprolegnia diclina VS20]